MYLLFVIVSFSCKKSIEIAPPSTGLPSSTVFSSESTAAAAVTGIYQGIMANDIFNGGRSISLILGLASDELKQYFPEQALSDYYTNQVTSVNNFDRWAIYYKYIYQCNAVLEGLVNSTGIRPAIYQQLEGEAKFIRAFLYFYLINLYGDVPLILSTDYRVNAHASRTPKSQVYDQIISDAKDAQNKLNQDYRTSQGIPTTERTRPNLGAATALLARVYLYVGDWQNAELQSTQVINDAPVYQLTELNDVFLKNSVESIFQLQSTSPYSINSLDGRIFILDNNFDYFSPVAMSSYLIGAFENGDERFNDWVGNYNGYYFPFKYKVKFGTGFAPTEHLMLMRLAEQFLIRAEARIQQDNIDGGISDLNILRSRARAVPTISVPDPLPPLTDQLTKPQALAAVEQERQVELFTEMGHRWLDLKRMKGQVDPVLSRADEVMPSVTAAKGGTWSPNWKLFPIPQGDIQANNKLSQNDGY